MARPLPSAQRPNLRRLMLLTMVLLFLWFSGPSGTSLDEGRGRRRLSDPKANALSAGGWYTGTAMPARARRSAGHVAQAIAARRRPGRRG